MPSALPAKPLRRALLRTFLYFMAMPSLVLAALKLLGRIAWPWWRVAAPLWGPWALCVGLLFWVLLHRAFARARA